MDSSVKVSGGLGKTYEKKIVTLSFTQSGQMLLLLFCLKVSTGDWMQQLSLVTNYLLHQSHVSLEFSLLNMC